MTPWTTVFREVLFTSAIKLNYYVHMLEYTYCPLNETLTRLKVNGDVGHGVLLQDALLVLVATSRHGHSGVLSRG